MKKPIGFRIRPATHNRLRRIAAELNITIGEVFDLVVTHHPPLQCELSIGARPANCSLVRHHYRKPAASRPNQSAIL